MSAGRFLLAGFGEVALVLDLETGALSRVSGGAVPICRGLAAGDSGEAVAARLVGEFGIAAARARADVESVRARIAGGGEAAAPRGPATFGPTAGGFEMRYQGRPVLLLDGAGEGVELRGDPASAPDPAWRLRLALPHLLVLRGQPVLHAAAARRGGHVLAISGASGAGKSTLAALLAGGATVSDDLVLLRFGSGAPAAILGGEGAAHRWVEAAAARLGATGAVRLAPEDLSALGAGTDLPLEEVWFLDEARRGGEEVAVEPAPGADGVALLLRNGFGELGDREVWRRLFEWSRAVAGGARLGRARVPASLSALRAAAERYKASVAS